jgi:uncharacterized membrane protein
MWLAYANYQANVNSLNFPCSFETTGGGCYFSDWLVQGWWRITPGQCAVPYGAAITNRYSYLHAEFDDGSIAVGSTTFRIEDPTFAWDQYETLHGAPCIVGSPGGDIDFGCSDQSYKRGFREIDTGNASNFVYNLHN